MCRAASTRLPWSRSAGSSCGGARLRTSCRLVHGVESRVARLMSPRIFTRSESRNAAEDAREVALVAEAQLRREVRKPLVALRELQARALDAAAQDVSPRAIARAQAKHPREVEAVHARDRREAREREALADVLLDVGDDAIHGARVQASPARGASFEAGFKRQVRTGHEEVHSNFLSCQIHHLRRSPGDGGSNELPSYGVRAVASSRTLDAAAPGSSGQNAIANPNRAIETSESSATRIGARLAVLSCVLMRPSSNGPRRTETPKGDRKFSLERVRSIRVRRRGIAVRFSPDRRSP